MTNVIIRQGRSKGAQRLLHTLRCQPAARQNDWRIHDTKIRQVVERLSLDIETRNYALYCRIRKKAGASQAEWAKLYSLGAKSVQQIVSAKEREEKAVNNAEALAASLLSYLIDEGYDVKGMTFDEYGNISFIPEKSP